jgi:hypothetical protein
LSTQFALTTIEGRLFRLQPIGQLRRVLAKLLERMLDLRTDWIVFHCLNNDGLGRGGHAHRLRPTLSCIEGPSQNSGARLAALQLMRLVDSHFIHRPGWRYVVIVVVTKHTNLPLERRVQAPRSVCPTGKLSLPSHRQRGGANSTAFRWGVAAVRSRYWLPQSEAR